ncbi:hypothetical protein LBMAG34_5960 [Candidatus Saccharibacteria bacterium]|nr:hypothetical protein LBMAG34_5960 [Candidatus Saccharibacteria bacterium]
MSFEQEARKAAFIFERDEEERWAHQHSFMFRHQLSFGVVGFAGFACAIVSLVYYIFAGNSDSPAFTISVASAIVGLLAIACYGFASWRGRLSAFRAAIKVLGPIIFAVTFIASAVIVMSTIN